MKVEIKINDATIEVVEVTTTENIDAFLSNYITQMIEQFFDSDPLLMLLKYLEGL